MPNSAATSAGEFTNIMGMVLDSAFYTNLFALAGAGGVTMDIDLVDPERKVLVWEGIAVDEVDSNDLDNPQEAFSKAISAIFSSYPYRAGNATPVSGTQ